MSKSVVLIIPADIDDEERRKRMKRIKKVAAKLWIKAYSKKIKEKKR